MSEPTDKEITMSHELYQALLFARSVIKCGEPWTDECDRVIDGAIESHKKQVGDIGVDNPKPGVSAVPYTVTVGAGGTGPLLPCGGLNETTG